MNAADTETITILMRMATWSLHVPHARLEDTTIGTIRKKYYKARL